MDSLLGQVKTFERVIAPELFAAMATVFPLQHFKALLKEGFTFYRTAFWHPRERAPANVFESVITQLEPLAKPSADVCGAEWWFSVLRTNSTPHWLLPCHFDRNDLSETDPEKLEFPERASVLFLNDVPYGELVVTDQIWAKDGRPQPKQPKDMLFIKPRPNRYAVFPGQLYHGVLGRMWRPLERERLRIAMAVNWWREKPKAAYLRDSRDCGAAFRLPM